MSQEKIYQDFQAHQQGFVWKGTLFSFSDIRNLQMVWLNTAQHLNLVRIGEAQTMSLFITLTTGACITLRVDETGFLFGWNKDKKEHIGNLYDLYQYLAKNSFSFRLKHYMSEIESRGYFTYDGCRFYPNDKIVFRSKEFRLADSSFIKGQGYVLLRPKNYTFIDKVLEELSLTKIPQFVTVEDTDVIFYLLEKLFGLYWEP